MINEFLSFTRTEKEEAHDRVVVLEFQRGETTSHRNNHMHSDSSHRHTSEAATKSKRTALGWNVNQKVRWIINSLLVAHITAVPISEALRCEGMAWYYL